jgi:hypothetical protein
VCADGVADETISELRALPALGLLLRGALLLALGLSSSCALGLAAQMGAHDYETISLYPTELDVELTCGDNEHCQQLRLVRRIHQTYNPTWYNVGLGLEALAIGGQVYAIAAAPKPWNDIAVFGTGIIGYCFLMDIVFRRTSTAEFAKYIGALRLEEPTVLRYRGGSITMNETDLMVTDIQARKFSANAIMARRARRASEPGTRKQSEEQSQSRVNPNP